MTTRARAEGAIEGEGEMYRVKHPFDTAFAFSRFDARTGSPRNITALRIAAGVRARAGGGGRARADVFTSASVSRRPRVYVAGFLRPLRLSRIRYC